MEIIEHDMAWLRNLHDVLLHRIASINLKHDGQDIRTALVEEPTVPSLPVSPNQVAVILVVLAGGIGSGPGAGRLVGHPRRPLPLARRVAEPSCGCPC